RLQTRRTAAGRARRRGTARTAAGGCASPACAAPSIRIPPDDRADLVGALFEPSAHIRLETVFAVGVVLLHAGDERLAQFFLGGHDQGTGVLERNLRREAGVQLAQRLVAPVGPRLVE